MFEPEAFEKVFQLTELLFDQLIRKWIAVVNPMSTQISLNSKVVGGLGTKEGIYGPQEKVFLLILVFIFFSR